VGRESHGTSARGRSDPLPFSCWKSSTHSSQDQAGVDVTETFFTIGVQDMDRATAFYVAAFNASVSFASAMWTSLVIAGVRIALVLDARRAIRSGLHFSVRELSAACADVERAHGVVVTARIEVTVGVVIAEVRDTEGNALTLTESAR